MTDDTISRAAAVSEIESIVDTMSVCMSMDECKGMRRMKKTVLERIETLPPAQPAEDIHREKEQAYYCGYEDGAKAARSAQPGEDIRAMCGECDAWNQYKNYPQPGWIPWDKNTRNSMVNTLQTLYRLAYNIHGVMDAIDDDNVKRLIALLEGGQDG